MELRKALRRVLFRVPFVSEITLWRRRRATIRTLEGEDHTRWSKFQEEVAALADDDHGQAERHAFDHYLHDTRRMRVRLHMLRAEPHLKAAQRYGVKVPELLERDEERGSEPDTNALNDLIWAVHRARVSFWTPLAAVIVSILSLLVAILALLPK